MNSFPQTKNITLKSYIDSINKSIKDKNFLAVLTMTLTLPDICSKSIGKVENSKEGYIKWFDKYVNVRYEVPDEVLKEKYKNGKMPKTYSIRFGGEACYNLRCFILHEGSTPFSKEYLKEEKKTRIRTIELSVNGKSDEEHQYGETKQIIEHGDTIKYTQRLNIVNFAKDMIDGCNSFLKEQNIDDIELFMLYDWDEIGNIIFVPTLE